MKSQFWLLSMRFFNYIFLLSTLIFIFIQPCQAQVTLTEGKQYTRLVAPVKNALPVVEFFSFYCPACSSFVAPYRVSDGVKKRLPQGIKLEKYHVSNMGKMGHQLTEAWSIAKALGVEDKVEYPLFEAVLKNRAINNEEDIRQLFIRCGVTSSEYDSAKNSIVVQLLTKRQQQATLDYNVSATPSFYVQGKYLIRNNGMKDTSIEGYANEFASVVQQLLKTAP